MRYGDEIIQGGGMLRSVSISAGMTAIGGQIIAASCRDGFVSRGGAEGQGGEDVETIALCNLEAACALNTRELLF